MGRAVDTREFSGRLRPSESRRNQRGFSIPYCGSICKGPIRSCSDSWSRPLREDDLGDEGHSDCFKVSADEKPGTNDVILPNLHTFDEISWSKNNENRVDWLCRWDAWFQG